jgi:K+-transporting ATPase ATPase A chain
MSHIFIEVALDLLVLVLLAYPLGSYIAKAMTGEKTFMSRVVKPIEGGAYRLLRIDPSEEMGWRRYLASVLAFSAVSLAVVMALLMCQGWLPGNPNGFPGMSWDLALNTAVSFVTNTNWQAYSGETTLGWFAQAAGLGVQNFLTPAVGMAVLFALIRGFVRTRGEGLGSFWVDLVRGTLYVFLPLSLVLAVCLVAGGVPEGLGETRYVTLDEPIAVNAAGDVIEGAQIDTNAGTVTVDGQTIDDATIVTQEAVPQGLAASQVAIKQLGTNGGGYFGTNSAYPLENPSPFTDFLELISILLIPAALCFAFGICVKSKKQGRALFAAMAICLVISVVVMIVNEQGGTAQLAQGGSVDLSTVNQAGGNMEGKEARFGVTSSSIWAVFTTAASSGSVNCMMDSLTPMGGFVSMVLMELGEVVFGGVGSGLYGMLGFAILTVFVAGLMVGRTPEFLGKKIEPPEMRMSVLVCLATPVAILVGSGIAALVPQVAGYLGNSGAHGFSELLYNFSSAGGNNGSSFAGMLGNTVFLNVLLSLMMLFARFVPIAAVLSIAGGLSGKRMVATSAGTLSTTSPMFVFLLIFIVILVGALSFFPALALGPVAEFLGSAV